MRQGDGETGGSGDGEGDGFFRREPPDLMHEFQREQGFTDADGVQPDPLAAGEPLALRDGVAAETLAEFFPVAPTAGHAEEKAGQQGEEDEREEKIVDEKRAARVGGKAGDGGHRSGRFFDHGFHGFHGFAENQSV